LNIKIGRRVRKDPGDLDKLIASIESVGLLQPVVVDADHRLVAGWRRLKAWKQLYPGKPIPTVVAKTLNGALSYREAEGDENICREAFLPSEAVTLGLEYEKLELPAARERQGRPGKLRSETIAEHADVRDIVGEAIGMSGFQFEKGKDIFKAADRNEAKYGDLVEMMDTDSIGTAHIELRRRKGARVKPKKSAKDKRIEQLIKAIWKEACKNSYVIKLVPLRNDVRELYKELLRKDPAE